MSQSTSSVSSFSSDFLTFLCGSFLGNPSLDGAVFTGISSSSGNSLVFDAIFGLLGFLGGIGLTSGLADGLGFCLEFGVGSIFNNTGKGSRWRGGGGGGGTVARPRGGGGLLYAGP